MYNYITKEYIMQERNFGRIENPDDRDSDFPVSAILIDNPPITEKYWWADGWWGDQGNSYHCVCYSSLHWLEDGPVVQDVNPLRVKPMINPIEFYKACQERDPWPGDKYNGTSIRSSAKILKHLGAISEYRWANNVTDLANAILTLGPAIVGTKWTSGMTTPNNDGIIKPNGTHQGGHAYLINGVNTTKGFFRIKNSWGQKWGKSGYAFISFDDFQSLLSSGGEACIAREVKVNESLDLTKLYPPEIL